MERHLRTYKGNSRRLLDNVGEQSLRAFMKTHQLNKKQAEEELVRLYNETVDIINNQLKENKKEKDRIIKMREKQNIYEITDDKFSNKIKKWNMKTNKEDKYFIVEIQSTKANVKREFKFNSTQHFENWVNKILEEGKSGSDPDSQNYYDDSVFGGDIILSKIKLVGGGCNKDKRIIHKEMKTSFYDFQLHNPYSENNNCLFACLSYIIGNQVDTKSLRKQFNLKSGTEISISDAYKVINELALTEGGVALKNVQIIDTEINEELELNKRYLLVHNNHYYVVKTFTEINRMKIKTKRGLLAFDFETRPTEEYYLIKASNTKSYILKDSLCCLYYKSYKSENFVTNALVTDNEKSSARKFLDWLNYEAKHNRSYNIIAHNGGKFDFYFLISAMTEKEQLECKIGMRGLTIISIDYRGNLFKDSCCFLTDTLANLSKSFKADHGKICKMNLDGKEITSSQLCFYRPELTFNQFLELQKNHPQFWELYVKYCVYDCIALYEIWEKFTKCVNGLVEKINPYLLRKCPLMSSSTIGSHSKKILNELNKVKGKSNWVKEGIEEFTGVYFKNREKCIDRDKYNFLCKFKRGGISHCNQAGKHNSGITGVDIASQYPASLKYSYLPTGKSKWIYEIKDFKYDRKYKGFYLLSNLKFDGHLLKPVAQKRITLNWATNDMEDLYVDSYMLEYIIDNYGLIDFEIKDGLVSTKEVLSNEIFGKYIDPFYEEKKLQDVYKESKKPEEKELYNEALRSTIKLYLNSLTGKLVENPSTHYSMEFKENSTKYEYSQADDIVKKKILFNGQEVLKEYNDDKFNEWIVAGIMVYSYSKRLLFEYIKCLPNNSDDVIHIETDGIYFSTRHLETFTENLKNYSGSYPCKFGEDLGNLKIEKVTHEGQVAYFLGKKFYCITMGDKNIFRVKGIPQSTIDAEGNKIVLVDRQLYDDVYNGKEVKKSFQTLRKCLFTEKIMISAHTSTRTIKQNQEYKLYN